MEVIRGTDRERKGGGEGRGGEERLGQKRENVPRVVESGPWRNKAPPRPAASALPSPGGRIACGGGAPKTQHELPPEFKKLKL